MTPDDPRHGTYAGWQTHRRHGEPTCEPCREARNAYMREHRKQNRNWKGQHAARNRALWALAREFPEDFQRLYVLELQRNRQASLRESA